MEVELVEPSLYLEHDPRRPAPSRGGAAHRVIAYADGRAARRGHSIPAVYSGAIRIGPALAESFTE